MLSVLTLILPALAHGFFTQRGDVFGFGPYNRNSEKLVTGKDMDKLDQAPINNLDSERAVGSVNVDLGVRASTEIQAVSDSF